MFVSLSIVYLISKTVYWILASLFIKEIYFLLSNYWMDKHFNFLLMKMNYKLIIFLAYLSEVNYNFNFYENYIDSNPKNLKIKEMKLK